jgi:hypothetical protein
VYHYIDLWMVIKDLRDIPMGTETHRMAIVNMDWDRIKAVDLFALLKSFVPQGGDIKSIKIYPSEFGKSRLQKEAVLGPPSEIFEINIAHQDKEVATQRENEDDTTPSFDTDEHQQEFDSDKLRKYQLERLR